MGSSISQHIFLFPFSWQMDMSKTGYLLTQHKQIKTHYFKEIGDWEEEIFELETDASYNEFVYFYKPVRPALYTMKNMPKLVVNYKNKKLSNNTQLELSVSGHVYQLDLEKVTLKLYKTGVGILSFYVHNRSYKEKEDILRINGMSRCIYPQLLPITQARMAYHPDWIRIYKDQKVIIEDQFGQNYRTIPIKISHFIREILGENFVQAEKPKIKQIAIEPIIGGQMFTLCMIREAEWLDQIEETAQIEMILGELMLITEEEKRLCEYGNISYLNQKKKVYGMSKSAFACMSRGGGESKLYDQLITLALMQRVTLLHFSSEIATISTLPRNQLVAGIQSVYEIYIQFINQMFFTEITLDLEGTQIYQLLISKLRIQEELKQLDFEMQEIHEYSALIDQSQSRLKMDMITVIGGALVIPTFVTGFFGMNILQDMFLDWWNHKEVLLWMNAYVFLPVMVLVLAYFWSKKRSRLYMIQRIVLLIILLASIIILWKYGCGLIVSS